MNNFNHLATEHPLLAKRKSLAEGTQRPRKRQNKNLFSPIHLFKTPSPKKRCDGEPHPFDCNEEFLLSPCESISWKTPSPVKTPPENSLKSVTSLTKQEPSREKDLHLPAIEISRKRNKSHSKEEQEADGRRKKKQKTSPTHTVNNCYRS